MAAPPIDTPARLLRAAREVFARDGLSEARMEDVAAAAGVSRAALYYHFHTKQELARALVDERLDELAAVVTAAVAEGPCERVVSVLLRFFAAHVDVARLLIADVSSLDAVEELVRRTDRDIAEPVRERIRRDIAAGLVRPLDPTVAAAALFGMVHDVVLGPLVLGGPIDLDHLDAELTELARRALAP